ncbi:DUF2000 family protein [uncultured Shewanella sp.]|uniref:DUF2000 family protein n=1 Tax=uncultured Shewanella sp. TaxID=173975 RepID=UPI00261B23A5|nr:DUF2000 family protein [uncultured Shewanella sp.]
MFDTKIVIVIRDDLQPWQKMNAVAFLTSGVVGQYPNILGDDYVDAKEHRFNPLVVQPMIVLKATSSVLTNIHNRSISRNVKTSVFIEEMFTTAHDEENREAFRQYAPDDAKLVGIALRAEKKVADKIIKGAKMYS